MRRPMWLAVALIAFGFSSGFTAADELITMEIEPPFIAGGQPPAKETYTVWLSGDRLREDRKERSVIVDRTTSKMYVIKHADKTYHLLDLPIDFESMVPEDLIPQWRAVLAARKTTVEVERTTETGKIQDYDVRKYEAVVKTPDGSAMNLTMWNTTSPGFDVAAFKTLMLEMAAFQPGATDWIHKLFEIEGYPVRMVRTFDTPQGKLVSTETVASVQEKPAPADLWKPSSEYTEVEFNLLTAAPE